MQGLHRPNILVIAMPSPLTGGGGLRALRSIKEYIKFFNTYLFIPWGLWDNKRLLSESMDYLNELKSIGVKIIGFSSIPNIVYKISELFNSKTLPLDLTLTFPNITSILTGRHSFDAVVVLHEVWDAVYSGHVLAEYYNVPSLVLLQLPPFYGSQERFLNILKSFLLWRSLINDKFIKKIFYQIITLSKNEVEHYLYRSRYEKILSKYSIILGVSKAIVYEMGEKWFNKILSLDPGVSLDEKDLEIMGEIKSRVREKENYIVFGGRASVDKGLVDALLVYKVLTNYHQDLKLVFTGRITPRLLFYIRKICRKLGIENKIVFTGFVSREKRFEIVAKSRLMIYPSHVDAFPYAVLESLHLGTPVVAYKIPAIEMYYNRSYGVELVKEWDLEDLTVKSLDLLEKKIDHTEPPKIKSWREIMDEEIEIISRLVEK
jgi:glycosyltransferase involved in cell wall biosynthesis